MALPFILSRSWMRHRRIGLHLFQAEGSFADLFRKCARSGGAYLVTC